MTGKRQPARPAQNRMLSDALLAVLQKLGAPYHGDDPSEVATLRAQMAEQRLLLERLRFELADLSAQLAQAAGDQQLRQRRRQDLEAWLAQQRAFEQIPMDKPHIERAAALQQAKAEDEYMCLEISDMLSMAMAENEMASEELAAFADVDAEADDDVSPGDESVGDDAAADAADSATDAGDGSGDDGGDGGDAGAGDGAGSGSGDGE